MFDPNKKYEEPDGSLGYLPAGKYLVLAEEVERRKGKSSEFHHLYMKLKVIGDKCKGRYVFERMSLKLDEQEGTPAAVKYAQSAMAKLCRSVGVKKRFDHHDSEVLHDLFIRQVFVIEVDVEDDTYNGKDVKRNRIKNYFPVESDDDKMLANEALQNLGGFSDGGSTSDSDDDIPF